MINTIFLRHTVFLAGLSVGMGFVGALSAQGLNGQKQIVTPPVKKIIQNNQRAITKPAPTPTSKNTKPAPASTSKKTLKRSAPLQLIKKPSNILALDFGSASLSSNWSGNLQKSSSSMSTLSYEWRPNALGIKVAYASSSKFDFEGSTPLSVTVGGPMLGVTGRYLLGGGVALTVEGGASLFSVQTSKTVSDVITTESQAAARAYGVLGLDYEINNTLALRLKYNQYASDFSSVTLGVSYAF